MQKDWGYAAFIEYGGKRVLFDTGNRPDILEKNAKAKGIDLSKLDFVVMSHRHSDHMGGMTYLLSVNPKVKIYAPKEGFGVYGGDLPSTFYRKDASLPPEQRYYDGNPPEVMRSGSAWPKANFELIDKDTVIAPGIHLIALVSNKPGTLELRELSLVIDTPDGAVVVVGCSHPGVEKILEAAVKINPRIHFLAGGLHLVVPRTMRLRRSWPPCTTPTRLNTSRRDIAPASPRSLLSRKHSVNTIYMPGSARDSRSVRHRTRRRRELYYFRWSCLPVQVLTHLRSRISRRRAPLL
jgi:7,8-dihydropterin-6-yl-methyl-4-(beta-D-ribofuranosyl)aminobenzene 5'-phosphate synthase